MSSTEDERARSACRHFSTTYFAAQPPVTEYIATAKQCSCTGSNNGVRRASKAVLTLTKPRSTWRQQDVSSAQKGAAQAPVMGCSGPSKLCTTRMPLSWSTSQATTKHRQCTLHLLHSRARFTPALAAYFAQTPFTGAHTSTLQPAGTEVQNVSGSMVSLPAATAPQDCEVPVPINTESLEIGTIFTSMQVCMAVMTDAPLQLFLLVLRTRPRRHRTSRTSSRSLMCAQKATERILNAEELPVRVDCVLTDSGCDDGLMVYVFACRESCFERGCLRQRDTPFFFSFAQDRFALDGTRDGAGSSRVHRQ